MSIEVIVNLDRKNAIFLMGESFVVEASITNTDVENSKTLAWGCVQLHCEQVLLRSAVNTAPAKSSEQTSSSATSLGAKRTIYSSKPAIIFCDIGIKPQETLRYSHAIDIPRHHPPSFKGHFVKYIWYVSIAAQHVDAPIKMVQLPIKILNTTVNIGMSQPSISNPFLLEEWQRERPSVIDIVLARTEELTSVRTQRVYEIKSDDVNFATITLCKNVYKLGDDLVGSVNFSHDKICCVQFLIRLETIEMNLLNEEKIEFVSKHFTKHTWSAFTKDLHFKVPLLLTITPSFTSEAVQLKWRVHFEFIITTQQILKGEGDVQKLIDGDLNVETVAWNYYFSVLSCSPYNVGMFYEVPSTSTMLL